MLVFIVCMFLLLTEQSLSADAYLAEDRIHYGADSYNVNYKDEVINATGNAYFRRGNTSVRASRIVIYYGPNEKRALFFDKVRLHDEETDYRLSGDYGESYFKDDTYIIKGNVRYFDGERQITAGKAETKGLEEISITEDVTYSDENLSITSQRLDLWQDEKAIFHDDVHTVFNEMGDEVFCRRLSYYFETGNQEFRDDVLYIQRDRVNEKGDPFIIRAEMVRYDDEKDIFLLLDSVFATDGKYSLRGVLVKYFRDREMLESVGSTIINDGRRTVYCDRLFLDLPSSDVSFIGSIQGVFDVE